MRNLIARAFPSLPYRRLLAVFACFALLACGDDDTPATDTGTDAGSGSGDASTDASQAADGPLYAVNVLTFSTDFSNQISFLTLTDGLEAGTLSLDDAIEAPGSGSLWGEPRSGELLFASLENLTVTKYVLNSEGRLEPQPEVIGLMGAGVASLDNEAITMDGPDRGFLFEMGSAQAIELDLENMEIGSTYDISALRIPSADVTYLGDGGFKRRGDEYVAVVFGSNPLFDEVDPASNIGFFDPSDGSLEVVEAPCGGLQYSFEAPGGDWYFSTDPWVAGMNALDASRAPAPCLVRLPAGSRTLDDTTVALNDVTGGATGGIIPGPDGTAFVRVLDQTVFPLEMDTGLLDPFSAPAWITWQIDLPDAANPVEVDRPYIAGGIKYAEVDGVVYQNASAADFSSTTLVFSNADGELADGLVVPGISWNIVRVR